MIQVFKLILWSQPREMDMGEMADIVYELLNELKSYGEELNPKYLPAKKKSLVKEFDLNKNNILSLLEKNTNREGSLVFLDLGRRISFFTSLNNNESSGISINIGVSNNQFNNTSVIDLPYGFSGLNVRQEEFEALFKRLVIIFKPFWGCVANSRNIEMFDYKYWDNDKPLTLHWMNYFDETTAQNIGINKDSPDDRVVKWQNGYFLKLQKEPIDIENPDHLLRQQKISNSFGLL